MTSILTSECGHQCEDAHPMGADLCCLCWYFKNPSFHTSQNIRICESCVLRWQDTIPDDILDHPPILALRDVEGECMGEWSCRQFTALREACEAEVAARSVVGEETVRAKARQMGATRSTGEAFRAMWASEAPWPPKPPLRSRIVTWACLTLSVAGWVVAGAAAGGGQWLLAGIVALGSLAFLAAWRVRARA